MRYLSVTEIAKKWNVSERSVRNYCAHGRVNGAFLTGKTWNIPENAKKPERINKRKEEPVTLLDILKEQKASKYSGGIYHKTQIDLTYNSNHIEGSRLGRVGSTESDVDATCADNLATSCNRIQTCRKADGFLFAG